MKAVVRLIMILALVGLVAWESALQSGVDASRAPGERLGRLVAADERDRLEVAALSLEHAGEVFTYARLEGTWRCLEYHQAVAADALVQRLVNDVLEAEGVTHSDRPERFAEYGVSDPERWRLRLHGRGLLKDDDRDTQLTVDLGTSVPALGGCFVRRPERNLVWAVDKDLSALVRDSRVGVAPPLLDPAVIPGSWPTPPQRIMAVGIQRSDGVRLRLELRALEISPEELQQGSPPFEWVLVGEDGAEASIPPLHAVGYTVFLQRMPWLSVVPASEASALGLDRLAAEVVLETDAGESLALRTGPAGPAGTVPVACSLTRMIYMVGDTEGRLLAPDRSLLLEGDAQGRNPWESLLKR